MYYTW